MKHMVFFIYFKLFFKKSQTNCFKQWNRRKKNMIVWWLSSQKSHFDLCKDQWQLFIISTVQNNNRQNLRWNYYLTFTTTSKLQACNMKRSDHLCCVILRVQRKEQHYTQKWLRSTVFLKSTRSPFRTCEKIPLIKYSSYPRCIFLEVFMICGTMAFQCICQNS